MASGIYIFGRSQFMRKKIDLINDSIYVAAVSTAYTPDLSSHEYLSDIPDAAYIGEVELEGNAIIETTFFANSATIIEPEAGKSNNAVVVFNNTGNTATSQLIAYLEVTEITTDGTPLVVNWDAAGIFTL